VNGPCRVPVPAGDRRDAWAARSTSSVPPLVIAVEPNVRRDDRALIGRFLCVRPASL
jgi:hypothetical protein